MRRRLTFILLSLASSTVYLDGRAAVSFAAFADLDSLSGVQQTFTVDNRFNRFADEFRKEQVALPMQESAVSDTEKKDLEMWQYKRSFDYGFLYSNVNSWARSTDDIIHTASPSVGMTRRSDYTYVALFYDLSASQHVEDEEANTVNHAQRTVLEYKFPKLKITFSNTYRPSNAYAVGTRTELQQDPGGGGKVSIFTNNFSAVAVYTHTSKTTYSVEYTHETFYFPSPENPGAPGNTGFSDMIHRVTPQIAYAWTPKTAVFAEYTFGADDYYRGGRFSSLTHEPRIGVSGHFTGKTSYTASIGYLFRNYEDRAFRDWNNPVVDAGLFRKISPKVDASLTYSLKPQERLSELNDEELFAITHFGGVSLTWALSPKISVSGFGKMGFTFQDGHITLPDIENPAVSYTRANESTLYNFGLAAAWSPRRYVNVGLTYDYTNFNATFKNSESDVRRLGGKVGVIF
jgi:hypothetical protein